VLCKLHLQFLMCEVPLGGGIKCPLYFNFQGIESCIALQFRTHNVLNAVHFTNFMALIL
jgi:hypothetical protein